MGSLPAGRQEVPWSAQINLNKKTALAKCQDGLFLEIFIE